MRLRLPSRCPVGMIVCPGSIFSSSSGALDTSTNQSAGGIAALREGSCSRTVCRHRRDRRLCASDECGRRLESQAIPFHGSRVAFGRRYRARDHRRAGRETRKRCNRSYAHRPTGTLFPRLARASSRGARAASTSSRANVRGWSPSSRIVAK